MLSWIICGQHDTTSCHWCYAAACGRCDGTCRTSSASPLSKRRWQNTTGGVTLHVRQVRSKVGKTQADRSVPQTLKHTHIHMNTEREVETEKYAQLRPSPCQMSGLSPSHPSHRTHTHSASPHADRTVSSTSHPPECQALGCPIQTSMSSKSSGVWWSSVIFLSAFVVFSPL